MKVPNNSWKKTKKQTGRLPEQEGKNNAIRFEYPNLPKLLFAYMNKQEKHASPASVLITYWLSM